MSKVLLVLLVIVLLASNGFLIYQDNRLNMKIGKLQNGITNIQKVSKSANDKIDNTDTNLQYLCDTLKTACF